MENNKIKNALIVVPARLNSSRLPNKVLADIGGKPMLQRVLEQCKKAIDPSKIVLCTESKKLCLLAKNLSIKFLLTSESCESGTDRIASVLDKLLEILSNGSNTDHFENKDDLKKSTLIINVQADQPFLDPKVIKEMCSFFYSYSELPEIVTPVFKLKKESIHNPAVVKALINQNSEAIYFSRSALPHVRDENNEKWHLYQDYWGHVGIYGFRADILSKWKKLPLSKLESSEKLEQLRLIDAGIKVRTFKVKGDFLSIDTQNQLEKARSFFNLNNIFS
tara:strand:- start:8472 stop:9305 length:834 start_codon:yes stop_codon:yes gene_type:complete